MFCLTFWSSCQCSRFPVLGQGYHGVFYACHALVIGLVSGPVCVAAVHLYRRRPHFPHEAILEIWPESGVSQPVAILGVNKCSEG